MSNEKTQKNGVRWNLIAAGVLAIAIFAAWFFLPVEDWLKSFSSWIEGLGVWGGVLFVLVYVIATVVLAPGAPLTIAAGLIFGLGWGFPIVVIGATLGACLAFLVARYLVRDKVKSMLEKRPKFKAVDKAVTDEGWKVVLLLRLSPLVPFNLQNYFFGITEIKFWHYAAATLVGILPGVLLFLYIGAAGGALTGGGGEWGSPQWAFFGVGLIATLVVVFLVTKKAKEKLKEAGVGNDPQGGTPAAGTRKATRR